MTTTRPPEPLLDPGPSPGALQAPPDDPVVTAYLAELGVRLDGGPSPEQLRLLHRAQVLRFGHDTVWKSRGRVPELEESALVRAVLAGEGGGCVHLSCAFAWLLRRLGYAATLHRARVQRGFEEAPAPRLDAHAVVLVELEGTTWHCDVGLGNGPLDCVPLVEGSFTQSGGFTYALERSPEPGRWLFHHDPRLLGIRLVDLEEAPSRLEDFTVGYHFDSHDPDSPSLRHLAATRRRADGVTTVSGRVWIEHGPAGRSMRRVGGPREWADLLRDHLGLALPGLTGEELDRLWEKAGGR